MNTNTNLFKTPPACTHKLIVYVPSTQGLDTPITPREHESRTKAVAGELSALFGGASITPSEGYYIAESDQEVIEGVKQVATACNWEDLQGEKGLAVSDMVAGIKQAWGQESMAIEVINNSNMYFV